jgi:hypothetical protein
VLVIIAVVVGTATWAVLRFTYVSLPPLPWTAAPTFLLLALGEIVTAVNIRARIQHKPDTKPIEPMVVARMAALAKASSVAGAVLTGVFAGFVVLLADSLEKVTPRRDFLVSGGTALASLVLVAGALFLEYACRVPKGPDDDRYDDRHPRRP